jgi:hypothetical protein
LDTTLDETLFITDAGKHGESDPIWLWTVAVTRRAHQLGIPLVAGTDDFGDPAHDAVPNIHRELRLLVEKGGLTPLEAIQAATRAIGIDRDYGTVEPGSGGPDDLAQRPEPGHPPHRKYRRRDEGRGDVSEAGRRWTVRLQSE